MDAGLRKEKNSFLNSSRTDFNVKITMQILSTGVVRSIIDFRPIFEVFFI